MLCFFVFIFTMCHAGSLTDFYTEDNSEFFLSSYPFYTRVLLFSHRHASFSGYIPLRTFLLLSWATLILLRSGSLIVPHKFYSYERGQRSNSVKKGMLGKPLFPVSKIAPVSTEFPCCLFSLESQNSIS